MTQYDSLTQFLASSGATLNEGPVACIFAEDDIELDTTLRHHIECGFKAIIALMPPSFTLPDDVAKRTIRIDHDCSAQNTAQETMSQIASAARPGCWLYYCYNAEYLFYPFSETRNIVEMLAFHTEERRDAMLTYVLDLYASDLKTHPNAVSIEDAHLDKTGYYAQARLDETTGHPLERQLNFYGGIRWRFEEHIPTTSRKIDRISLFRAKPGLKLRADHTLSDPEMNTYACAWHHNLTAAICSFRTAKALRRNPGSRFAIDSLSWRNSVPFEWHSRQLLDLGLVEPGQWF